MNLKLPHLIILLAIQIQLLAQAPSTFERITTNDGLSDNFSLCLHQDKEGFMWIGTMTGLNRYDGKNIKSFDQEPEEGNPYFSCRVDKIKEDSDGNLWLKNISGQINFFNKSTHSYKSFPAAYNATSKNQSTSLFLHNEGIAILGFSNLGIFVVGKQEDDHPLLGKFLFDETQSDLGMLKGIYAKDINHIWVNTQKGLYYLKDLGTSKEPEFIRVDNISDKPNRSQSVLYHDMNKLYFGYSSEGLIIYDINTHETRTIPSVRNRKLHSIISVTTYRDEIQLLTAKNGLVRLDIKDYKLLYNTKTYNGHPLRNIRETFRSKDGNTWFVSPDFEGAFCLKYLDGKLKYYPTTISPKQATREPYPASCFAEDGVGNIWIGIRPNGFLFYDKQKDILRHISNSPHNSQSLISNRVQCFCLDEGQNMWIGTQFGISKTNVQENHFKAITHNNQPISEYNNKTDALYRDSYGNYWCSAYSGEIYVYDSNFELKQVYKGDDENNGFKRAIVFTILEDSKGRLWIGSKQEGLFLLDLKRYHSNLKDAQFEHFLPTLTDPKSIHGTEVYDILEDRNGRIWLANYSGGLNLINETKGGFEFIDYNALLEPVLEKTIKNGRCLLQDSKGKLWYGGVNGIVSFSLNEDYSPKNTQFFGYTTKEKSSLSYHDVGSLYEDEEGIIWIGTTGGGLNAYNPDTEEFTYYTIKDGLANNLVYATINDNEGNLWISTKNGLSKLVKNTKDIINYRTNEGLATNQFTEAKPFAYKDKLYFGTIKGLCYFAPTDIKASSKLPNILFTDLVVSNEVQKVGENTILQKDINLTQKIELKHFQNNFSLSYSTDGFHNQNDIRFEYQLKGFDNKWFEKRDNDNITYTNVPSGYYTLNIKLSSETNPSLFKIRSLKVRVTPPLLRRPLALVIYALLLGGLIVLFLRMFKKNNELQQSLKVEKEINDFKLRFFTNISHELRTPLTLIINPIKEVIKNKSVNKLGMHFLETAQNNASNLLRLVNEILDFRKIQTQNVSLNVSENEAKTFFQAISNNFGFVSEQKEINYTQNLDDLEQQVWFDLEKVEKISTNLLTNAFKYTKKGGQVAITVSIKSGNLSIVVQDTGEGFDDEMRQKAFTRYYKAESKNRTLFSQGAGIGLSLVEEFVRIHKGHINLESQKGEGSTFTVTIPCSKEAYTDQELSASTWIIGSESEALKQTQQVSSAKEETNEDTESIENTINNGQITLLLVEDNDDLRTMLEQKLKPHYNIETAENGEEGMIKAKELSPHLIVTDLLMPKMNGVDMTKALKQDFDTCHIPIIMLTAKAANEDKIEGYQTGADAYLTKPFDFEVLESRIKNLLEQRAVLQKKFGSDIEFDSPKVATDLKDQEFIKSVVDLVIKNLDDSEYTLKDISSELAYSTTPFYKKIKAISGLSPSQFIRTIKLKESAKFIKQGASINEAANYIGYSDVRYFSRQFKVQFGTTPSQYRKDHEQA